MESHLFIGAGFYFLSTVAHLFYLFSQRVLAFRLGHILLGVGLLVHTIGLVGQAVGLRGLPVGSHQELLSFLAWGLVSAYLIAQARLRLKVLGAFVSPVATLFLLSASAVPGGVWPVARNRWLPVHVTLLFVGEAIFALAFLLGTMYLIQEHLVKRKRVGPIFRQLPSLAMLDKLNFRCLTLGFPLLTLGMITGAFLAQGAWGAYWSWEAKEVLALITWLLYAGQLYSRLTAGWRGRRAAIFSIAGFIALLFTFLGVRMLSPNGDNLV